MLPDAWERGRRRKEMAKSLAICVEDVGSQSSTRYMRCVALPGRQPGLRLDEAGQVVWQSDEGVACELCVSADGRLVLYRPEGAIPISVHRAGRSLDVPCSKPVFIIDKDEVGVGERLLRIHVHGEAPLITAPSPLPSKTRPFRRLAQAATAVAIAGTVSAVGCKEIEIRDNPPVEVAPTPTIEVRDEPPVVPLPETTIAEALQGAWTASQAYDVEGERTWITGTLTIEGNAYTFEPLREIEGPSVQGMLDFLFETPEGEVAIEYSDGVMGEDVFYTFAPGDTLAVYTFYVDSAVAGEFLVRVGDAYGVYFHSLSDEVSLWRVAKTVEMY
jgi:hypothetical protein